MQTYLRGQLNYCSQSKDWTLTDLKIGIAVRADNANLAQHLLMQSDSQISMNPAQSLFHHQAQKTIKEIYHKALPASYQFGRLGSYKRTLAEWPAP